MNALTILDRISDPRAAAKAAGLSKSQASRRYPARLARYLLPMAWMEELRVSRGRALRVCEIGTGSGQMKKFADFCAEPLGKNHQPLYEMWAGYDIAPQTEKLRKAGYHSIEQFDADQPLTRDFREFDVVLLLHVLEHLKDPEAFFPSFANTCDSGTCIMIGVPASAEFLARRREMRLRQKYLPGGHWCKFSPARLRRLMSAAGLINQELTGAFFLRASGFFLEDFRWWFALNLRLAALLPDWPGEVYCRGFVR